ncbi:hypothetical protein [uncultured Tateyamaria sp.]|uniref:hypothetical protein n=1 Tax=uncultured Tateyamaria sp. TaxID=455651 RepID=UPI0026033B4D|nr:hypothetical protein [uncultured Tateyamaria sp.]
MADDHPLPPLVAGQIRFYQASPPALPPGDYTIKVAQDLSGGGEDGNPAASDSFAKDSPFAIVGPRFTLKPNEVYSVYPPKGHFGPFDNALPHVVFTRRTLPWERTIDPTDPNQDADFPVPWMALILLGPGDFEHETTVPEGTDRKPGEMPNVTSRTVGALLNPGDGFVHPQGIHLDYGQTESDLCNTIDVPVSVFTEVVPSAEDLPFLAHVREVKTGGKETLSLQQDGWFTVVLGNRLPETTMEKTGIKNRVCLVSLEGFKDHLPVVDANGVPSLPGAGGAHTARMAVLASWDFTCYGTNDFKVRMTEMDDKSLLSLDAVRPEGTDEATKAVQDAFALGYAPLNHTTRLGEKTVSWYRGPMITQEMAMQSPFAFIPTADRALRYDATGMFAAEYASAYELGRMLALQNRGFASAMYRYRNTVKIAQEAEKTAADLAAGFYVAPLMSADDTLEDAVAKLFETSKEWD